MMWSLIAQGGKQIVTFTISVVIARLVMPEQFGMIAMLGVFTSVANLFADVGLSTALTRKTDRSQTDCSTVYWFNIGSGTILYSILFICAPLIADFYDMVQLSAILRVSALTFIIGPLTGVHQTLLSAELNYRILTKVNLISLVISGLVGMLLAYLNFQVWALVIQNLTLYILSTIFVFNKVKWRPSFVFSRASFNEFFGFGSKLLASQMLNTLYNNITPLVIGKKYCAADLAYFNRANSLGNLTTTMPTGMLQSITFPMLCKLQHDDEALKNGYRRTLCLSAFIIFPACLGVGAVSYPLINTLYTEKWMFAAPLLSIMVFNLMWHPVHAINLNYLIVKGKSDLFLRIEIIKKIQGLIMLFITVPMGIEAMCYGGVISSIFSLFYNTYYTGKFLGMTIFSQLKDMSHILLLSGVMYICARLVANFMGNDMTSLICSIATGAIIYIGAALMFRFPEVKELMNLKK